MEWLDLTKNIIVVCILPLIYWLRLLILKQEEISGRLSGIADGLSTLEKMHQQNQTKLNDSLHVAKDIASAATAKQVELSSKIDSIESKISIMILSDLKQNK